MAASITVLREAWRPHPLAWIHRAEAGSIADELRRAGRAAALVEFREDAVSTLPPGPLLLRVSDPVMLYAATRLTRAALSYIGPGADVIERCYDKHRAHAIATAAGVDSPATALASAAESIGYPLILKPRRGSDSIGVRLLRSGPLPAAARTDDTIAQEYIRGTELTVAVIHGRAGTPLRILLPEGTPYSFLRKYLLPRRRVPLTDFALAERVRHASLSIAGAFAVDWAVRIDLIQETGTGRLRFLECDAAPLVGTNSAFAASLSAAGLSRSDQLRLLLNEA
jgi:D-alanine-D-alanine ligase-like ATP-grasp enzyme